MKLTPELVKAIVKTCNSDERFSQEFTEKITELDKIYKSLLTIRQQIDSLNKNHQLALDQYARDIKLMREHCPHYILDNESDPAGGNDSFHQCTICELIT